MEEKDVEQEFSGMKRILYFGALSLANKANDLVDISYAFNIVCTYNYAIYNFQFLF